jgi:predicted ArsR family transcriptional regulator
MKNADADSRRLVRIERATGIDRKELRTYLEKMEANELLEAVKSGKKGRGGHPIISWNITESGRMWRSDLGRFIQLGQRLDFYPESFFYLPSDGF